MYCPLFYTISKILVSLVLIGVTSFECELVDENQDEQVPTSNPGDAEQTTKPATVSIQWV